MRTLFITSLLITISFWITVFSSCSIFNNDYPCGPHKEYECVELYDIIATPIRYRANHSVIDVLVANAEVKASYCAIQIDLTTQQVTCKTSNRLLNSFVTSAYACTPPIPYLNFRGTIKGIDIISDNDFDSTHKAGQLLNDVFYIPPLDELNNTHTNTSIWANVHILQLVSPPDSAVSKHRFTVEYSLTDGEKLSYTTIPIKIKR